MRISYLKQKLVLTSCYLCILVILNYYNVPCIFQLLFSIPCPGCGMTHAVLAAIRLDFISAFQYHPMFWSLPLLYLYFLLDVSMFRHKRVNKMVLWSICFGFIMHWLSVLV